MQRNCHSATMLFCMAVSIMQNTFFLAAQPKKELPTFYRSWPSFGPLTGSLIHISGKNFDRANISVIVGNTNCSCTEQISKQYFDGTGCQFGQIIICAMDRSSDEVYVPLPVKILYEIHLNGITTTSGSVPALSNFTFVESPVITDLSPRRSFVSGGLKVTIVGNFTRMMTSPRIRLYSTFPYQHQLFEVRESLVKCEHINNETYVCEYPPVPRYPYIRGRYKTQDGDACLTNEYFHVNVVIMYGQSKLLFEHSNSTKESICLVEDPVIQKAERIEKDGSVFMVVSGRGLNRSATGNDYEISAGGEMCKVISLSETEIYCGFSNISSLAEPYRQYLTVNVGHISKRFDFNKNVLDEATAKRNRAIKTVIIFIMFFSIIITFNFMVYHCVCIKNKGKICVKKDIKDTEYSSAYLEMETFGFPDEETATLLKGYKIREDEITLKGSFTGYSEILGRTCKGDYRPKEGHVNIEVLLKDHTDSTVTFSEAKILSKLSHSNVISMVGIVRKDTAIHIVFPDLGLGNLKDYFASREATMEKKLEALIQVADGMNYVNTQGIIHRDLRALNCEVGPPFDVKVSGFGNATRQDEVYVSKTESSRRLPIRWTAREVLDNGRSSLYSDVWSFGVLMWEVLMRGVMPYKGRNNKEVTDLVLSGGKLEKPSGCSNKLYKIMRECWQRNQSERPSFSNQAAALRNLLRRHDDDRTSRPDDRYLQLMDDKNQGDKEDVDSDEEYEGAGQIREAIRKIPVKGPPRKHPQKKKHKNNLPKDSKLRHDADRGTSSAEDYYRTAPEILDYDDNKDDEYHSYDDCHGNQEYEGVNQIKRTVRKDRSVMHQEQKRRKDDVIENRRPERPPDRRALIQWYKFIEYPKGVGMNILTSEMEEWFHGIIGRKEAEMLLRDEPKGAFLVRPCERLWGYAVSCRIAGGYRHFLIDASAGQYQLYGNGKVIGPSFATLQDLINYHRKTPITTRGQERLLTPCPQKQYEPDYAELLPNPEKDNSFSSFTP